MSFNIDVDELVCYVARCREYGCSFDPEIRTRRQDAEVDADVHLQLHKLAWEKQQRGVSDGR